MIWFFDGLSLGVIREAPQSELQALEKNILALRKEIPLHLLWAYLSVETLLRLRSINFEAQPIPKRLA